MCAPLNETVSQTLVRTISSSIKYKCDINQVKTFFECVIISGQTLLIAFQPYSDM